MIPDFPHNIRIRLAWLNWDNQRYPEQRQDATKKIIGPILFLYYEESLASSNLNSKLLRFHCAHPNVCTCTYTWELIFQVVHWENWVKTCGQIWWSHQSNWCLGPKFFHFRAILSIAEVTPNPILMEKLCSSNPGGGNSYCRLCSKITIMKLCIN